MRISLYIVATLCGTSALKSYKLTQSEFIWLTVTVLTKPNLKPGSKIIVEDTCLCKFKLYLNKNLKSESRT